MYRSFNNAHGCENGARNNASLQAVESNACWRRSSAPRRPATLAGLPLPAIYNRRVEQPQPIDMKQRIANIGYHAGRLSAYAAENTVEQCDGPAMTYEIRPGIQGQRLSADRRLVSDQEYGARHRLRLQQGQYGSTGASAIE